MRNAQDNAAHTCSYSCDRPECIKAQRDELAAAAAQEAVAWRDDVGNLYPSNESVDKYLPRGRTVHALYAAPVTAAPTGFDRARETPRRQRAVELLLSMGYQWRDSEWIAPGTPAAPGIDHAIFARDIHHAIADAGLAPMSPADNYTLREVIRSVIDAGPKGEDSIGRAFDRAVLEPMWREAKVDSTKGRMHREYLNGPFNQQANSHGAGVDK